MEKKVLDIINNNKSEDSGIGKTCLDTINTEKPKIVATKTPCTKMNANRFEDSGMGKNALGKLNKIEPEDAGV